MPSQQRDAAIVGIRDALTRRDGDGDGGMMSGLALAEYFGLHPNVIDTTMVGGSSYEFHAAHAKRDLAAGKARVALLSYGSTSHSNAWAIGVGARGGAGVPMPADNMEGFTRKAADRGCAPKREARC